MNIKNIFTLQDQSYQDHLDFHVTLSKVLRGHNSPITRIQSSGDGRYLISKDSTKHMFLWDTESGDTLYDLTTEHVAISPDGVSIVYIMDSSVVIENMTDHKSEKLFNFTDSISDLFFCPNTNFLIILSKNKVMIWDVEIKKLLLEAVYPYDIEEIVLSPKLNILTIISEQQSACFEATYDSTNHTMNLNLQNPSFVLKTQTETEVGYISNIAFSPDGELLAYVRADMIHLIKMDGFIEIQIPFSHSSAIKDSICAIAFSKDGKYLSELSASQAIVAIWEVAYIQELFSWNAHGQYFDNSTGGNSVNQVSGMLWSDGFIATSGTSPFLPPSLDPITGQYEPLRGSDAQEPKTPDDYTVKIWKISCDTQR